MRSLLRKSDLPTPAIIIIPPERNSHDVLHELPACALQRALPQRMLGHKRTPIAPVAIHPGLRIERLLRRPDARQAKVRADLRPLPLPRRRGAIGHIERALCSHLGVHASVDVEPSQDILGRVRMQRGIRVLVAREGDFVALAGVLPQRQEQAEGLGDVHGVVLRHEADDGVGSDFAEGPGFAGGGALHDVALRVVEDVLGVGGWDARGGFFEGRGVGHFAVEFDAVGLIWICQ